MCYPFEQYIPRGQQDVPRMRGFKVVPNVAARVCYEAARQVRVERSQKSADDIMNGILEGFVNPFVQYHEDWGSCSPAVKVLRQVAQKRELGLEWPTMEERLAKRYIAHKPRDDSWFQWVNYWKGYN